MLVRCSQKLPQLHPQKAKVNQLKPLSDITQGDVEHILEIVDRLNDIEIRLEFDGMRLHVRKFSDASLVGTGGLSAVAAAQVTPQLQSTTTEIPPLSVVKLPAADTVAPDITSTVPNTGLYEVRAPMLGRFFRAPSPSEPPYVEVGSKVRPEDPICVIEVMKLFSTVPAGAAGTIVEILVEDGVMVECDSTLFRMRLE